ncbi:jerky-like protein [Trichonephila clavipes]|nr:jerky-like protein [Trichonephila clavipes]
MEEDRATKKVFNAQLIDIRRKGRSNLRWIDGLEKDLLVFRTKNWRTLAGRRLAWKRLLEKSKTHPGLSSHWRRKDLLESIATTRQLGSKIASPGRQTRSPQMQCSTVVSREAKSDGKTQGQGYLGNFSCVRFGKHLHGILGPFVSKLYSEDDSKKMKTTREANDIVLDRALYLWFSQRRSKGDPISGLLLCEKAPELNEKLGGLVDFKASTGWLKNFKSRHGIRKLQIEGESLSGDKNSCHNSAMEWYKQQSESCPDCQLLLLKRIRLCSEKTKVYNGTAKNKP